MTAPATTTSPPVLPTMAPTSSSATAAASPLRRFFLTVAAVFLCAAVPAATGARHRLSAISAAAVAKPNATEQFLSGHNQARAAVGVAPLRWAPRLAAEAGRLVRYQRDKKACEFADMGSTTHGANQAWSTNPVAPAEVVAWWVGERTYYNHTANTCAAGHECGSYTQVVWRRTAELGCAQASCGKGPTLTLCFYNPHGNVQGQSPY